MHLLQKIYYYIKEKTFNTEFFLSLQNFRFLVYNYKAYISLKKKSQNKKFKLNFL
jgi:hypothetical protein